MDRNLAMELVRVTEAAALASARFMGRGDEAAADMGAIDAMKKAFGVIAIDGTVVIGEGAEDAMPMLYVGERSRSMMPRPSGPTAIFSMYVFGQRGNTS